MKAILSSYHAGLAGTRPVRALREVVQVCFRNPVLRSKLALEVAGLDELRNFSDPALIVANRSSHLDTAVILCTLPRSRRQFTAVAAGGAGSPLPRRLLDDGWSIIVSERSAAELAVQQQVPVIPVGLRGTYAAAMPQGGSWLRPGRARVAVRYGRPIFAEPDEPSRELAVRIASAIEALIAEDATSWWAVQRGSATIDNVPPAGSWRRTWEHTAEPTLGGKPREAKIWRS
jgi:1-acyl-sn-glycerol-3-phosphate acyltransferase